MNYRVEDSSLSDYELGHRSVIAYHVANKPQSLLNKSRIFKRFLQNEIDLLKKLQSLMLHYYSDVILSTKGKVGQDPNNL